MLRSQESWRAVQSGPHTTMVLYTGIASVYFQVLRKDPTTLHSHLKIHPRSKTADPTGFLHRRLGQKRSRLWSGPRN